MHIPGAPNWWREIDQLGRQIGNIVIKIIKEGNIQYHTKSKYTLQEHLRSAFRVMFKQVPFVKTPKGA